MQYPDENICDQIFEKDNFDQILNRIHAITNTTTQKELAEYLKLPQAMISDAERRTMIPACWMHILRAKTRKTLNLSSQWLFTGEGEAYQATPESADSH